MSVDSVTNDNYVVYNGVQVAPFRTLNDFALDARFGKPQFADWKSGTTEWSPTFCTSNQLLCDIFDCFPPNQQFQFP
uniref:Uncharacterized protein n=1 Tax=Ditylenchus dipsaci TaxID=166011 RepID=A0A915EGL4_9BILA